MRVGHRAGAWLGSAVLQYNRHSLADVKDPDASAPAFIRTACLDCPRSHHADLRRCGAGAEYGIADAAGPIARATRCDLAAARGNRAAGPAWYARRAQRSRGTSTGRA